MQKSIYLVWIIFLFSIPFATFSQTRNITGKVADEKGNPIPLAQVQEKGTNNATTANDNGNFSISVKVKNPVLVV